MPVTNRGVVQLTPLTSTFSSSSSLTDYFNSLPPSLAHVQTALAIFALFVIAKFCLVRLFTCLRRLRGATERPILTRTSPVLPHHRFQFEARNIRPGWAMDEKNYAAGTAAPGAVPSNNDDFKGFKGKKSAAAEKLVIDTNWPPRSNNPAIVGGNFPMPRPVMSRPPPAPPLTPPELSTAVFTFEDRPRPGDDSFMRQPNPDYMSSTTGSDLPASSSAPSPSMPRRRSYNKTLPIGVPIPQPSIVGSMSDAADLTFSPSSYPPTSPLLPPAPPRAGANEIDVKGEIIGVLDGEGAGWTRHTRVYGGGVCLACAASGGNHGSGGFYGATLGKDGKGNGNGGGSEDDKERVGSEGKQSNNE
ncbi:hypothetical protein BGZ63DRAFT_423388 [Mariannaea sp. PMI_226]|nr:hypothetical protein BGZ63DRAFT_423388 [Mariannaea sp. PMI_226]